MEYDELGKKIACSFHHKLGLLAARAPELCALRPGKEFLTEGIYYLRYSMLVILFPLLYHLDYMLSVADTNKYIMHNDITEYNKILSDAKTCAEINYQNIEHCFEDDLAEMLKDYRVAYNDTGHLIDNIVSMHQFIEYSHEMEIFALMREDIERFIQGALLVNRGIIPREEATEILHETDMHMQAAMPELHSLKPLYSYPDKEGELLHPVSHWWWWTNMGHE